MAKIEKTVEITLKDDSVENGNAQSVMDIENKGIVHADDNTLIPFHAIVLAGSEFTYDDTPSPDPYGCDGGSPRSLAWADATDEHILDLLEKHYAGEIDIHDYWSVGDTRKISLSAMEATGVSESHVAQDVELVLVNAGGKTLADGETECAFIVMQKDALIEPGYIDTDNNKYWGDCKRRTWCNSVYKNAIPASIASAFKEFINPTGTRAETMDNSIKDYFALAAEKEVFGAKTYAVNIENARLSKFDIFTDASDRVKHEGDGGAVTGWWLRSYRYGMITDFVACGTSGTSVSISKDGLKGIAPFGVI